MVGAGLIAQRPRWTWTIARAALNAAFFVIYRREAARPDGHPQAAAGARRMVILGVLDGGFAFLLARRGR